MTYSTLTRPLRAVITASFCLLVPATGNAAGSGDNEPPRPTETTTTCPDGYVYDTDRALCVQIRSDAIDDDTLYQAVREFAYAGDYENATLALNAMSDQSDDRVLTYRGFILRKTGQVDEAMAFYERAIVTNPDNLLVRSYMGQGLVTLGRMAEAQEQLAEIRARGGSGTWPELALASALSTGRTYDY